MAGWHLSILRVWGPAVGKSRGGGLAQRAAELPGALGMDGVELFGQGKWGALSGGPRDTAAEGRVGHSSGESCSAPLPPSPPPVVLCLLGVPAVTSPFSSNLASWVPPLCTDPL